MTSNPNVIQDAYAEPAGRQFWERTYVTKDQGRVFQVDIYLEKDRIGQGHARCSVWTPNGWTLVSQLFDGETEANGSRYSASTYSRELLPLLEWSGDIINTLVGRAQDIIS